MLAPPAGDGTQHQQKVPFVGVADGLAGSQGRLGVSGGPVVIAQVMVAEIGQVAQGQHLSPPVVHAPVSLERLLVKAQGLADPPLVDEDEAPVKEIAGLSLAIADRPADLQRALVVRLRFLKY